MLLKQCIMDWKTILAKVRLIKEDFDRSHKCINQDRPIKTETLQSHIQNLLKRLEEIRVIFNVNYNRLTPAHKVAADAFFLDLKTRLDNVVIRKHIDLKLPDSLQEEVIQDITITTEEDIVTNLTMTSFSLETTSKALPLYSGNSKELDSFIITAELINKTLSTEAKVDFLQYVYHAKLTSEVRTAIGNYEQPPNFESLIKSLRERYRSRETIPELQGKLNNLYQGRSSINSYRDKITLLIDNLNKLGIQDIGTESSEAERNIIKRLNNKLALDTFKKGLNENLKQTVYAARPNNLQEAFDLALELENEQKVVKNTVLHMKYERPQYQQQNYGTNRNGFNNVQKNNRFPHNNNRLSQNNKNNNYSQNNSNKSFYKNNMRDNNRNRWSNRRNDNFNFHNTFNSNNNNDRRNKHNNQRFIRTIHGTGNERGSEWMNIPDSQN